MSSVSALLFGRGCGGWLQGREAGLRAPCECPSCRAQVEAGMVCATPQLNVLVRK